MNAAGSSENSVFSLNKLYLAINIGFVAIQVVVVGDVLICFNFFKLDLSIQVMIDTTEMIFIEQKCKLQALNL